MGELHSFSIVTSTSRFLANNLKQILTLSCMKNLVKFSSRNQTLLFSKRQNIKHLTLFQLLENLSWVTSLAATKSLHAITTTMGSNPVQPNVYLHNNIISRYILFDDFCMAKKLFDKMPQRNEVSYNTMISACSRKGYVEDALGLFSEMRGFGMKLTEFSFGALLGCSGLRMLDGVQLHGLIVKNGLMCRDAFAGTALLGFFGRNGLLSEGVSVFEFMPIKSLVTWNSMISLFGQHGLVQDSLFMFREVMRHGIEFSESTLVGVISCFKERFDLQFGEQVHGVTVKCGLDNVVSVANCLLNMYATCSSMITALELFDAVSNKDIVTWNTIVAAAANGDAPETVLEILLRMSLCSYVSPNDSTFVSVISSCTRMQNVLYGEYIHSKIIKKGLQSNVYVGSALVNFYINFHRLATADSCFDEISEKNMVSWNTLMRGYSQDKPSVSLYLLKEAMQLGHLPNEYTFSGVVNSCLPVELQQLHSLIIRFGYCENEYITSALMASYARNGLLTDAFKFTASDGISQSVAISNVSAGILTRSGEFHKTQELFSLLEEPDLVSWNVLITACSRNGDYDEAFELFKHMQKSYVHPDNYTYVSLFSVCAQLCNLALGSSLHGLVTKYDFSRCDTFVCNVMIDMYGKCGCLKSSVKIFNEMTNRNGISWTALISSLGLHGYAHEALQTFSEMESAGFKPDKVAFTAILSACRHGGLVEEGMAIFKLMKSTYGIEPDIDHYHIVVDLFARCGHIEEAEQFISQMPFPPNEMIWRSFLEGCKRNKVAQNLAIPL